MKKSPRDQDLASLLGPSKFSADGFLGDDPREPDQIIADDMRELEKTGVEKTTLVSALRDVYRKAETALGNPVKITDHLTAEYIESRGKVPSPFRGDGMFQKGEVDLKDDSTGKSVIFTALSISLIEKHDFFQGRGSRYRLEPAEIVELLGLKK